MTHIHRTDGSIHPGHTQLRGGLAATCHPRARIRKAAVVTAVAAVLAAGVGTAVSTQTELSAVLATQRSGDSVRLSWTDPTGAAHTATVDLTAGPAA